MIGARVGGDVKTLPSAIYWNALRTFGILRSDVDPENVTRRRTRQDDSDEVATRQVDQWSATIRPVPLGFPSSLPTGLDLSAAEAAWLQERMLQAVPDSLLVSMLKAGQPPSPTSQYPWDDPIIASVPTPIRQTVRHAQMFSLAIYGSSLLYSMEVARAYEEAGFNAVAAPVERLASAFERWTDDIDAMQADLRAWDRQAFWGSVLDRNQRITIFTRRFVDTWLDAVVDGRANEALEDPELRALVEDRERNTKRGQARLANKKLLGSWGGQAGAPLSYRWALAKTIVTDIDDGLRRTEDSGVSA